ncbi:MAG: hypothetical protein QME52_01540 [Bacteroidota bacterium]|nr:hypothetical protein [Bacteroidota bacterium]
MRKVICLFLFLVSTIGLCFTQDTSKYDPNGTVRNQMSSILVSNFGNKYFLKGYEILDSALVTDSTKEFYYNSFVDHYGTLQNCIIFWALQRRSSLERYENDDYVDTSIVGFVKDGNLLWHSGYQIKGDVEEFYFSYDINNDRKVELGFWDEEFTKTGLARLYIIRWDGSSGEIINDVDSLGRSVILGNTGRSFDIIDTEGNGVYNIRGEWLADDEYGRGWYPDANPSSTAPYVTYGWNGQKYGYWENIRQVPSYEFLPNNRIKLLVRASVTKENNRYTYTYDFKSDSTSRQLIDEIFIANIDTVGTIISGVWNGSYTWVVNGYYWRSLISDDNTMLHANQLITGSGIQSVDLPGIKTIYAKGSNALGNVSSPQRTRESVINDVLINSYHTQTVGPTSTPSPFDSLNFLDTLTSYTTQSRTLGWITEQSTAGKYTTFFDSAKVQLQRNAIRATRATLDTVLANANQDSSHALTSEAYALIYFNTEYLLNQLPTPPPQYNLNINTIGNGTVTKSPELALYDSSTTVTLTANPSTGYRFSSWSGDVLGTVNPISVVMNSEKNITATFLQNTFIITATAGANGTIAPSGDVSVVYGANQLFAITPNTGYHIADVIVDQSSVGAVASYTFTSVTAPHAISSTFAVNTYTLTVNANNGTVTKNPNQPTYNHGTSVQLTATPATGYSFVNWSGDLTGSANPANITMNANKTITTNFAINTYTLTINATNGTVTNNPNQPTYNHGTSVQLTATPATGYSFVNWSGDLTGSTNPVNITMNSNKTVTANFTPNPPTITSFTPTSGPVGTSVTITGTNFIGITAVKFNGVTASYTVNSPTQITATVPTGATTGTISVINASGTGTSATNFTITYTLTILISGEGIVLKSPDQTSYTHGTSVRLTAKGTVGGALSQKEKIVPLMPEPTSWRFDHWEIDLTGTQNPKTIIMNRDKTVRAVFVPVY